MRTVLFFPSLERSKDAHDGGFIFSAGPGDLADSFVFVHASRLTTDKGFIGFNVAGSFFSRI